MKNLLKGIRILDLSRLLPGGYTTMILADMGAEVIKIENPADGDYMRTFGPPNKAEGIHFLSISRNKKSVTINLKHQTGRNLLLKLAAKSHVVFESFRPGVMDSLGLGFEDLQKVNSNLIYCSLSGYGQKGSFRKVAGHDINYLSLSGILALTGQSEGPPVMPIVQIADMTGGMFAAIGIVAGIVNQISTGKGKYMDVSMFDGLISLMGTHLTQFIGDGAVPRRGKGFLNGGLVCYTTYETKDKKFMAVGALEEKFWEKFCSVVNRPDLRPCSNTPAKVGEPTFESLKELFHARTQMEWIELFRDQDACVTPVLELDEVVSSKLVRERDLLFKISHPTEGDTNQVRLPFVTPEGDPKDSLPPPTLGQHTNEILLELGYSETDIEQFKAQYIV